MISENRKKKIAIAWKICRNISGMCLCTGVGRRKNQRCIGCMVVSHTEMGTIRNGPKFQEKKYQSLIFKCAKFEMPGRCEVSSCTHQFVNKYVACISLETASM